MFDTSVGMEFLVTNVRNEMNDHGQAVAKFIGNSKEGWSISAESAIRRIESRRQAFYYVDSSNGETYFIGVAVDRFGEKFLRGHNGKVWNDSLLNLPSDTLSMAVID